MKRILSLILVMVFFLGFAVPAFAAESESAVSPRYTYIARLSSGLDISNLGIASCGSSCWVPNVGTGTVKFYCRLQRYENSTWKTVKTWSKTGGTSCVVSESYAVSSGYKYRLRNTCSVYSSAGVLLESGTCYSNEVTY